MKTCDTCKHWTKNNEEGWMPNAKFMASFGSCQLASDGLWEETPLDVVASNSNEPDVTTGPKFGCIHHEPK